MASRRIPQNEGSTSWETGPSKKHGKLENLLNITQWRLIAGKNHDFPLSCWITRGGQCFFASNLTGQLFGKLSPIIYLQGVHDAGCILETYMRALSMITTRPLAGFMAYLVSRGFLVACLRTLAQLCNVPQQFCISYIKIQMYIHTHTHIYIHNIYMQVAGLGSKFLVVPPARWRASWVRGLVEGAVLSLLCKIWI